MLGGDGAEEEHGVEIHVWIKPRQGEDGGDGDTYSRLACRACRYEHFGADRAAGGKEPINDQEAGTDDPNDDERDWRGLDDYAEPEHACEDERAV